MFHALAEVAEPVKRGGQGRAVAAGVCVLTPVLSIVVEAGIRNFFCTVEETGLFMFREHCHKK